MNKFSILIINYNYTDFILNNLNYFLRLENCNVIIVDDQSKLTENLQKLNNNDSIDFIKSKNPKSEDNSLNQLNAIKIGFDYIFNKYPLSEFIWTIDGDDYPNYKLFNKFSYLFDDETVYFIAGKNINSYKTINIDTPKKGLFWVKKTTTSQIIINKKIIEKNWDKIFLKKLNDYWYDARLCSLFKKNNVIINEVLISKIIHGKNDSLRYKKNIITKIIRIILSIINSYALKIIK